MKQIFELIKVERDVSDGKDGREEEAEGELEDDGAVAHPVESVGVAIVNKVRENGGTAGAPNKGGSSNADTGQNRVVGAPQEGANIHTPC